MDYTRYTQKVGFIHAALQRLEFRIRVYLETIERQMQITDYEFHKWKTNDLVPENALTNRKYFPELIASYNVVATPGMRVDPKLGELRNIIIHGRVFQDPKRAGALRLINFGRGPKDSKTVKVLEFLDVNDLYFGDILIRANRAAHTVFSATVDLEAKLASP
jgi:hypothetical protein